MKYLSSKQLADLLSARLSDQKAENITYYDVVGACGYADFFIVVTARSTRHAQAIAENLEQVYKERKPTIEGKDSGNWVLMDFNDVVVHIFTPESRPHYNFDKLWGHREKGRLSSTEGQNSQLEASEKAFVGQL